MTPELWERLKPLFNEALELPSSRRKDFISGACKGDQELQRELLALVEAHEQQQSATQPIDIEIRSFVSARIPEVLSTGDLVLGRFKIARHLGDGGMGNVYEAFDLELSQSVALKMIRPEVAEDEPSLSRFRKEVQLARRLNGPNICRIHEFFVLKGERDSRQGAFLTMELLDGVTLADEVRRGPLSKGEALAVALDICAGLATIHAAGMIHRDIKSRNIMLANRNGTRRAVVMDFGLARELTPAKEKDETGLTLSGALLGTPGYMAPEQFDGGVITPATDIYALGIVLYELSTGKHPFASPNAIGTAVLRGRQLEPASSLNRAMPHRWDAVIGRCLEFEASRRYQSAEEVADALRPSIFRFTKLRGRESIAVLFGLTLVLLLSTWFVSPVRERLQGLVFSNHVKHIAVLPFDIGDNNPETLALGDGLMDSLAGKLSNLDHTNDALWVVPASEVRRRKVRDPESALREFGATTVIKGSFRRINHIVRLNLALIDTHKMRETGFADIDSDVEDLAGLQDEALKKLGRLMNVSVKDEGMHRDEMTVNGAPYESYITALGYLERYDKPGNLDGAIRSLTEAVKAAPRFALAFGALGRAYTLKYLIERNQEALVVARDYCARALSLDDLSPDLHATLAELDRLEGKYELAEKEFHRVINLDSRNVEATTGLAELYLKQGRLADAEKSYIRASELRPDDWKGYDALGRFYDNAGRQKDAVAQFEHALRLSPDNADVYNNLGGAYINSNDSSSFPAAEKALIKSISLNPGYAAYANLGSLYSLEQRFNESAAETEKALDLNADDYAVWDNLNQAYEALGDDNKAFAARKRAIDLTEKVLALNPRDAEAHAVLGSLQAQNHSREEAYTNIRAALALNSRDQSVLSEVAEAYEALGDRSHAIKYLHLALQNGFPKMQIEGDVELKRVFADPNFPKYEKHSNTSDHNSTAKGER
jgi:serine/threonine-protein kinase